MEYPTVALVDQSAGIDLPTVIIHEAGHNWFYGMLGSNERDYAWMDEGMNTFYEMRTRRQLNKDSNTLAMRAGRLNEELFYYQLAKTGYDQSINQTSALFTKVNYGVDVYYKTSVLLRWLEQYMGEREFELGMKDYFAHWQFRHPYPEDFRASMEQHSNKSLDWFFDKALYTSNFIDFKIAKARVSGGQTQTTLRNNSHFAAPVKIQAYLHDSVVYEQIVPPFEGTTTVALPVTEWTRLTIDSLAPDARNTNDQYRHRAIFPRFGLQFRLLAGTNNSSKNKVFVSPALGFNQTDALMAGLVLHNLTLPENRFRFCVAPMFSLGAGAPVGAGSVGYMFNGSRAVQHVIVQADVKSFHQSSLSVADGNPEYARYLKTALGATFQFRERDALSNRYRELLTKLYQVSEDMLDSVHAAGSINRSNEQHFYALARYTHRNDRTYNPFGYRMEAQYGTDFVKLGVEGNARVDYNKPGKALRVRAYFGKFLALSSDPTLTDRYKLNASFSGRNDYLFDGTYLGRNETSTFAGQQISIQEGGFKVPLFNNIYRSDNWLAAINLSTDFLPGRAPVKLFLDAGITPNFDPSPTNSKSTTSFYDAGIEVSLVDNFISLYVPLVMSGDMRDAVSKRFGPDNVLLHSISFSMQLQNMNWMKSPMQLIRRRGR
ncbi:MAG: hypothetical protein EBZ77_04620 [Chitinophagia bacterium]|nr:hypothetical protein [Chitinophagia bacterium]